MKKTILLFILLLATANTRAGHLIGRVLCKNTGNPLVGANVYIKGTTTGGATDARGVFRIKNIPAGKHELMVSMMGYTTMLIQGLEVKTDGYRVLKIRLAEKVLELGGVEITADKVREKKPEKLYTVENDIIEPRKIKHQVGTLDDYYRAVVNLPSVAQRNDFSPQLSIRGGSPDQNLVLYNGIEVLVPTRLTLLLGGGVSLVNPDIIAGLEVNPGGFGVEYGNKISGILHIRNRDGGKKFSAKSGISAISGHACMEGPLLKGRGSWILAGRRSLYDLAANRLMKGNHLFPYYHDVHFKTSFHLSPDQKLSLFYTHLGEGTRINGYDFEEMDIHNQGSGHIGGLAYGLVVSKVLAFHSLAGYYEDFNDMKLYDMNNHSFNAHLKYHFKRMSFKGNMLFYPAPWLHMKTGMTATTMTNDVQSQINWRSWINLPDKLDYQLNDTQTAGFFQISIKTTELLLTGGLRTDFSRYYRQSLTSPRIKFHIFLNKQLSLWTAHGLYTQYPDVMTIISRGTPLDLSQNQLRAEKATHHIAGCGTKIKRNWDLKLEAFQKSINDMLTPRGQTYMPENNGIGRISGFELNLVAKSGPAGHWGFHINYALYAAKYRLKENNEWLYFDHDQRHRVNAGLNLYVAEGLNVGFNYHLGSGFPYTPVLGMRQSKGPKYDYAEGWQLVQGDKNSSRYPWYSRLDIRVQYHYRWLSIYLDVINVMNRKNIYYYEWDFWLDRTTGRGQKTIYQMMPFLPTIGCSFEL